MKRFISIVIVFAFLAGTSVLATHRLNDRGLFVPPPEAVAEGFYRAVVLHRPAQAGPCLLKPVPVGEIVALQQSIESLLGRVDEVKAEVASQTDHQAQVRVELKSSRASHEINVPLVWNGEEWKVVQSAFQ